jgi:hypothetical protein
MYARHALIQTEMVTKENLVATLPGAVEERRRDTTEEDTAARDQPRWLTTVQIAMSVWIAFWMVRCVVSSLHWPLVNDGSVLSYIVFLIDHGMAPYRDIVETSFPGTYLLFWMERHTFGPGAFAFRLFDLAWLAVAFAAMMVIAQRRGMWFAGVFGSAFFLLAHTGGSESINDMGQRDFIMSCLLLCCFAFVFETIRRQKALLMFGAGFCLAAASAIKPTSLAFGLVLLLAFIRLRRMGRPLGAYLWMSLAGIAVPSAIVVSFLVHERATGAFIHIVRNLLPVYAVSGDTNYFYMFWSLLGQNRLIVYLLLGCALAALHPRISSCWEQQLLFVGSILGAISYMAQHKGFHYQATPFLAFAYIWIATVLVGTLNSRTPYKNLALAVLLVSVLTFPLLLEKPVYDPDFLNQLHRDLSALGAEREQGKIQCMEETAGCLTVLDEMKVVQTTGFVADVYFFLPEKYPIVIELRQRFLAKLNEGKPNIIVLADDQWPGRSWRGYDQLESWPAFEHYLGESFHICAERDTYSLYPRGYRIYVRNDSGRSKYMFSAN